MKYLVKKSIHYEHLNAEQDLPLALEGNLTPGTYQIDGGVSSQFITGLLFALPLLPGDLSYRTDLNLGIQAVY